MIPASFPDDDRARTDEAEDVDLHLLATPRPPASVSGIDRKVTDGGATDRVGTSLLFEHPSEVAPPPPRPRRGDALAETCFDLLPIRPAQLVPGAKEGVRDATLLMDPRADGMQRAAMAAVLGEVGDELRTVTEQEPAPR